MKCPENVLKSTLRPISFFFLIIINQWIEFKFENVKYISIYLTNNKIEIKKK
jgi:hypothetical protein